MKTATVDTKTAQDARRICSEERGFTPDAIRPVDSGGKDKAWLCFESAADADTWDKQR